MNKTPDTCPAKKRLRRHSVCIRSSIRLIRSRRCFLHKILWRGSEFTRVRGRRLPLVVYLRSWDFRALPLISCFRSVAFPTRSFVGRVMDNTLPPRESRFWRISVLPERGVDPLPRRRASRPCGLAFQARPVRSDIQVPLRAEAANLACTQPESRSGWRVTK